MKKASHHAPHPNLPEIIFCNCYSLYSLISSSAFPGLALVREPHGSFHQLLSPNIIKIQHTISLYNTRQGSKLISHSDMFPLSIVHFGPVWYSADWLCLICLVFLLPGVLAAWLQLPLLHNSFAPEPFQANPKPVATGSYCSQQHQKQYYF